jgi:hypothetical protein
VSHYGVNAEQKRLSNQNSQKHKKHVSATLYAVSLFKKTFFFLSRIGLCSTVWTYCAGEGPIRAIQSALHVFSTPKY